MVLNQDNQEIFGDDSNHISCAIHHGEGAEARLKNLLQILDSNDSFHSEWLVRHNLVGCDFCLALGAVVAEQGDLLGA